MGKRREPRVALVSLGCAKNTVDSETALGALLGEGFALTTEPADADLVLLNTCAFIGPAREESQRAIAEALALRRKGRRPAVMVMGCYPERDAAEMESRFPELSGIVGFADPARLAVLCRRALAGERIREVRGTGERPGVARETPEGATPSARADEGTGRDRPEIHGRPLERGGIPPRLLLTPSSYAYLRVSEGCDNRCAYCAIPRIRGPLRSRPDDEVLAEARGLLEAGVRELVLVAQDVTAYGIDRTGRSDLASLLQRLLGETTAQRIRLLYAHPAHLDDAVIRLLGTEPRLCRYLDLPLQHVNSRILRAMGRPYDRPRIERLLGELRRRVPALVLRTTMLVGFPGETEEEFQEMLDFIREGPFQRLGAFGYSREAGTPAAGYADPVPASEIDRRLEALLLTQQEVAFRWLDSRLGQTVEVLVDRQLPDRSWEARSLAEAPDVDGVILLPDEKFRPGATVLACLEKRAAYDILAVPAID